MGGEVLRGCSGQWGGRWELEGSRDVSSRPRTVAQDPFHACPRSTRAPQHLLSPPSPSGFYSTSHGRGSLWKTDWNSRVLTTLYGFWHFAFSEAWVFFITDLYYLLVSSSSVSNG